MSRIEMLLNGIDEVWGDKDGWIESAANVLSDVSEEEANWHPALGIHSIVEIVNHVAYWTEYGAHLLHDSPVDDMLPYPEDGEAPASMALDWQAARDNLLKQHQDFRAGVARLSDESLDYEHPGLGRPVGDAITSMIEHDAYHVGQIFILRQLYGKSEKWKAESEKCNSGLRT
jgi:uncharacterized damage-inducible protein DinB